MYKPQEQIENELEELAYEPMHNEFVIGLDTAIEYIRQLRKDDFDSVRVIIEETIDEDFERLIRPLIENAPSNQLDLGMKVSSYVAEVCKIIKKDLLQSLNK